MPSTSYNPRQYWNKRYVDFSMSLRAPGSLGGTTYNQRLYRLKERCFKDLFRDVNLGGAQILNFGCGNGYFDDFFERQFNGAVTGIDISDYAVSELQKRHPHRRYLKGDITEIPSIEQRFDLVTAFDVLYHITDRAKFRRTVEILCGLVRPQGLFLFTDHLHGGGLNTSKEVDWHWLSDYETILKEQGFVVDGVRPMYWLMDRHDWITRRLPSIVKFSADYGFAGLRRYRDCIYMARAHRS